MSYEVLWEDKGVVRTFFGVVNSLDVIEADQCFYRDSRSDNTKYQITDFTNAVPGDIDDKHIEAIAAFDYGASYSIPEMKIAFVTKDPYVHGLCQQYIDILKRLNSSWLFIICEDMVSARKWLSTYIN